VIGCGYVGLVTASGFATAGHSVIGVERDQLRLSALRCGRVPFYEPGVEEQVQENMARARLTFTDEYAAGLRSAEFVLLAVNTPVDEAGRVDLTDFWQAAGDMVRASANRRPTVIVKSTVPVGTTQALAAFLSRQAGGGRAWRVVANPEFLTEGSALRAFRQNHRVVIGSDDEDALEDVASLYATFEAPIIRTDSATAELIKYGSNAFLATKVSFINELAHLCERAGADVRTVARGMGLDPRIAPSFLRPGVGFGGSCLPKDARALARLARDESMELLLVEAAIEANLRQRRMVTLRLREELGSLEGRSVALWGLAFKPNTDDIREAPAGDIIEALLEDGAEVRAYDPIANDVMRQRHPEAVYAPDALSAARDSDALVLLTEWDEFRSIDFAELRRCMRGNVIIDGRYLWERGSVVRAGLRYLTLTPEAPKRAGAPAAYALSGSGAD
jgi:UDPglucose 6-dehydrogenase